MKAILTSQENEPEGADLPPGNINENDPRQLKLVISHLITKSKSIVGTLESTVARLEKVELEREYWKKAYLRFRQACQKYIDADGLHHYQYITQLEEELRKAEAEKQCMQQEAGIRASNIEASQVLRHNRQQDGSKERSTELKSTKRKQRMQKSISTVSFNREVSHSQHRIAPKKITLVKPKVQQYIFKN